MKHIERSVIPGRRTQPWLRAASPESILPGRGYGFRARGLKPAPRNDAAYDWDSEIELLDYRVAHLAVVGAGFKPALQTAPTKSYPNHGSLVRHVDPDAAGVGHLVLAHRALGQK